MPAAPPTLSQWRARPVFISSTFRDMQAERSYLQSHVFPRLEEKLRERRHQFEPIDLRMGVETAEVGSEEARDLHVLKVCLEEIQRSRPFLIVILGDRYGWVPPPERMESATQEAGFSTDVKGKSVTALEIEFGVLKEHPDQRHRSFFYFREPLPYDLMPPEIAAQYSDAYSPKPEERARHERLKALKQQILADPELGPRAYAYDVTWDAKAQRVTGLQEWGDGVFEHLWSVLDQETRDFASQPPQTWEQQERDALTEFISQRSRDFTGRESLIQQLLGIATSPFRPTDPLNTAALNAGITWGACVTGSPGSGKSALMAELYQRLAKDDSILILANAAGATPRGTEPDAMLRRFIGELAAALGIADPLPENAGPDEEDATFASLLARAAQQTRVVVLLDALDQFDATPRGQHLTWLRARQWPGNARLIATGITGTAPVDALSQWAGVDELNLPALATSDVAKIAKRVWARYHRQVNPEVLLVLSAKKLPDGKPATANPLWLTLALEQLNLLDADDFARADSGAFSGTPAERIRALLVDTATRMPPDVPGLYGWLLEQTEKCYGTPHARAFAVLIALGRFGWRETDLMALVPRVACLLFPQSIPRLTRQWYALPQGVTQLIFRPESVAEFDALSLASIRRGYRAHLTRRGAAGQLDFFHAQIRQAVQACALGDAALVQSIHRAISDHLEALPSYDSLRESELMVHLIEGDLKERAARLLADVDRFPLGVPCGATQAIVRYITRTIDDSLEARLEWVTSLPMQNVLVGQQTANVANRFFDIHDALAYTASLSTLVAVIDSARQALTRLAASDPANEEWRRDLSVSLIKLGDLAVAQGDLAGALLSFSDCHASLERLAASDPANDGWQRGLSVSLDSLGDLAVTQGDLAGALRSFTESKTIRERLAASDPADAVLQRGLSVSINKLGDLAVAQGDLAGASRSFTECKTIRERLAASDPANATWQCDISVSINKLGDLAVAQGDLAGALRSFTEGKTIAERLAASDPANAEWQRDLSVSINKLGDLAVAQGDLAGALRSFTEGKTIRERLAASDPANAAWQRDLFVSIVKLGDLAVAQGDLAGALRIFTESKNIIERLADSDPAVAGWQRDLIGVKLKIAETLASHGKRKQALQEANSARGIAASLLSRFPDNTDFQLGVHSTNGHYFRILTSHPVVRLGQVGLAVGLCWCAFMLVKRSVWLSIAGVPLVLLAFLILGDLLGPWIWKTNVVKRNTARFEAKLKRGLRQ